MSTPRAAFALRLTIALPLGLSLACTKPPSNEAESAKSEPAKSEPAKAEPAKPDPEAAEAAKPERKPFKVTPRDELMAKDLPPPPDLANITLKFVGSGSLPLPEDIGVVLPHVALQLEQGLLIAGQAFVDYDPQIRATEIWQFRGFIPTKGEPQSSKGESGSVRTGMLDGKGGAVLVGTLGVGMAARAWAARIAPDGSTASEFPLDAPNDSDILAVVGGGPADELAVLGGFASTTAWLRSIDDAGKQRWQPTIETEGFAQIRALARIDDQAVLAVGTVAQQQGSAWSVRVARDGSVGKGATVEIGPEVDPNRTLVALADRGEAGLVGLGLAKRSVVQDHDQVFAAGFDRAGKVEWVRAIASVRAKQVRGAMAWKGTALFVLEVPSGQGTMLALLQIAGPTDADIRVEQIVSSEGRRSPGFVRGSDPPQVWIAETKGKLNWQRFEVPE